MSLEEDHFICATNTESTCSFPVRAKAVIVNLIAKCYYGFMILLVLSWVMICVVHHIASLGIERGGVQRINVECAELPVVLQEQFCRAVEFFEMVMLTSLFVDGSYGW